jgi:hypothetical protein
VHHGTALLGRKKGFKLNRVHWFHIEKRRDWGVRPFRAISGGHLLQSPVQQGFPVRQHFLETQIHQAYDK